MDDTGLDMNHLQAMAASQPKMLGGANAMAISKVSDNPYANEERLVQAYRDGTIHTTGERAFDGLIYWANGFGVNLLLSTLITYYFVDNKVGRQGFEKMLKVAEKAGVTHKPTRETLARAFTLLLGGHITAAGVKIAEDHKLETVKWLDNKFYGPNAEDLPEIKAGHDSVAGESKPTWLNIATARIICWGVIQAAAFSVGNEEKNLLKSFGEKHDIPVVKDFSVEGWSRIFGKKVADNTPKALENGVNALFKPIATHEPELIYRKLLHYGSIDTLYTMITAALLKPVVRQLSKLPGMRIDPKIEHDMLSASHTYSSLNPLKESDKPTVDTHESVENPVSADTKDAAQDRSPPQKHVQQANLDGIITPPPLAAHHAVH